MVSSEQIAKLFVGFRRVDEGEQLWAMKTRKSYVRQKVRGRKINEVAGGRFKVGWEEEEVFWDTKLVMIGKGKNQSTTLEFEPSGRSSWLKVEG
ncbi:hypothetical protein PG988_011930 [Apiospora saccharicola]